MQIISMKIAELKEYKSNAKLHPSWHIAQIVNSIEEFGFNDPIAIDGDNVIIEGHGRLLAAKELALDSVPVIKLTHLTDTQKRTYIIAHNKLTMNTEFDMDVLSDELEAINNMDINIKLTEFGLNDISDICNDNINSSIAGDGEKEFDEGIDTNNECPKCGYVW